MKEFNVALVAVGGLTLVLSLVAGLMRNRAYVVSEPMAAVALGLAIGPAGAGVIRLSAWGDPFPVVEQFARLTVGLAVVAAALRLPRRYFRDHVRSMAAVLVPGMIGMWLVSGLLAYALLDVSLLVALLIGAIVTPTDPVLAGTIVTGSAAEENIPGPIRDLLSAESGANDGLAYPLVFLPILLIRHAPDQALSEWFLGTVLWDVAAAVVIGAAVGAAAGWVEKESREYEFLDETSLLSVTVALTFFVLGGVKLLGSDGILAAFAAGLLFNRFSNAMDETDEQKVQETVLRLFTFPVFVLLGTVLPVDRWLALGWAGVALGLSVVLLRRLPMIATFRAAVPAADENRDALFSGWFGPIGVAALYYAAVGHRMIGDQTVWTAATLVIASSVVAHGVTATPLTKLYGRMVGPGRTRPGAEEPSSPVLDER